MNYKDYQHYKQARDAAWRILIDCQIKELPVPLNVVYKQLGIRIFSYVDASQFILDLGLKPMLSKTDGLSLYNEDTPVVLFDQSLPIGRKRFTIGHELGHIILRHVKPGQITIKNREPAPNDDPFETVANQFAARLLAPACVLWGLNIHTPEEISRLCHISITAARFRAERMEVLYKRGKFLTSPLERQVFEQFHDFINRRL